MAHNLGHDFRRNGRGWQSVRSYRGKFPRSSECVEYIVEGENIARIIEDPRARDTLRGIEHRFTRIIHNMEDA
jgi:hypothetical protein